MLIESVVIVGVGLPRGDRSGVAALVECDDDNYSVRNGVAAVGVGGGDVDAGVDATRSGVNDTRGHFDRVAHVDRPQKPDPGDGGVVTHR